MAEFSRLPEAEFEVMQIIWSHPTPISAMEAAVLAAPARNWKPQTVITLLARLSARGFLASEKRGKERMYTPLVARDAYLNQQTGEFVRKFHQNSLTGLMSAFYAGKSPKGEELAAIKAWLAEREREDAE